MDVGLTFRKDGPNTDNLTGYSDSDFTELKDMRHSTVGHIFTLARRVVSHSSKRQPIIALSSCEVEYMCQD